MTREKRLHPRIALPSRAEEPFLVDISRRGLFIRTADPWAVGNTISLDLQPEAGGPPIPVHGRVVRSILPSSTVACPGMGIELDPLPPDLDARYSSLIRQQLGKETPASGSTHPIAHGHAKIEPKPASRSPLSEILTRLVTIETRLADLERRLDERAVPSTLPPIVDSIEVALAAAATRPSPADASTNFLPVDQRGGEAAPPPPASDSTPPPRPAGEELPLAHLPPALDRREFEQLLDQGQGLARTPGFLSQTPTAVDEILVASGLERDTAIAGLKRDLGSRLSEKRLTEILFSFYRRGLVEFD